MGIRERASRETAGKRERQARRGKESRRKKGRGPRGEKRRTRPTITWRKLGAPSIWGASRLFWHPGKWSLFRMVCLPRTAPLRPATT